MDPELTLIKTEDLNRLIRQIEILATRIEKLPVSLSQEIFTDNVAAALLGVSKKTMSRLRNRGSIGFVQHEEGRKILYTQKHIDDYLTRNERKPFRYEPI